jgi:hypothetical protein
MVLESYLDAGLVRERVHATLNLELDTQPFHQSSENVEGTIQQRGAMRIVTLHLDLAPHHRRHRSDPSRRKTSMYVLARFCHIFGSVDAERFAAGNT